MQPNGAKCREGHWGGKRTRALNARDKRFMVRSDGNKVTASTDPSCGVDWKFGNLENNIRRIIKPYCLAKIEVSFPTDSGAIFSTLPLYFQLFPLSYLHYYEPKAFKVFCFSEKEDIWFWIWDFQAVCTIRVKFGQRKRDNARVKPLLKEIQLKINQI